MHKYIASFAVASLLAISQTCSAQVTSKVVDLPTRQGVSQRLLLTTPERPLAVAVLFAGGHGGLQIFDGGSLRWGDGNFLVRIRTQLADHGIVTALIDSPSDRQRPPFLEGFRTSKEHVADIAAVTAALKKQYGLPVWLVGTSRGTQSVAYAATQLQPPDAPDGIVLTATILKDEASLAVPHMALDKVTVPTLVVHHSNDQCRLCLPSDLPRLTSMLARSPRFQLTMVEGGTSSGNPCSGAAHHGFNGVEDQAVRAISSWILSR